MKIIIILILISIVILSGCSENEEIELCIECEACPTCPKQECSKQVCKPEIQIKEVIKEKIIKEDCTIDRAGWYIKSARDELKDYYEDFDNKRYEECKEKIEEGEDLILTGIGFYKLSGSELYIKAYEDYLEAISVIYSYCNGEDWDSKDRNEIIKEYKKWYNRYIIHIKTGNITKEMWV